MTTSKPVVCPLPAEAKVTPPFTLTVSGVQDLSQGMLRQRPVRDTEESRLHAEGHKGSPSECEPSCDRVKGVESPLISRSGGRWQRETKQGARCASQV